MANVDRAIRKIFGKEKTMVTPKEIFDILSLETQKKIKDNSWELFYGRFGWAYAHVSQVDKDSDKYVVTGTASSISINDIKESLKRENNGK